MTNFLRRAMTSAGSASSRLEKSDRSVRARQRIVPGGGDAEPAGSIVGFAILSPFFRNRSGSNPSGSHAPGIAGNLSRAPAKTGTDAFPATIEVSAPAKSTMPHIFPAAGYLH